MPQNVIEKKTYDISGVEIFAVGTWNGVKHDIGALHSMVTAFNALKPGWIPFIKLGHDPDQKIIQNSGLPAIGWIKNLYVRGDKLLADFEYVPEEVYTAIKNKAYRKVSCEIYYGVEYNGETLSHVLSAVALLGADLPGVMNLNDILSVYSENRTTEVFAKLIKEDTVRYSHTFETPNMEDAPMPAPEKTEAEIKLEQQLAAQKLEMEKFQSERDALQKERDELAKDKSDNEAKALKAELDAKAARQETFINKMESDKLLTPVTKVMVGELLSDKKDFSLKLGASKEEKKFTREELLEEVLKLTVEAAKVNFEESSLHEYGKKKGEDPNADDYAIKEYMDKNKCSYDKAYRAVMKDAK